MIRKLAVGEFIGNVLKTVCVTDAQLTLVRHDEARVIAEHTHSAAYFCVLLHGSYSEHYEDRSIHYNPFSLALHPAGYRHWDEIGEAGSVFFMIELQEPWNAKLAELIDLRTVKVELRGQDLVWLGMRIFKEFSEFDAESAMHIESLLLELVAAAARVPEVAEPGSWFGRAIEFVETHYTEPLTMKEIAAVAAVHPVTLARAFRSQLGQTASEYINRLRVRLACERILNGRAALAGVSDECGFIDQSYFTKVFKGITGTTPAAFRETVTGSISTPP